MFKSSYSSSGGSIYARLKSNIVLKNCIFESNQVEFYGGALYLSANSSILLEAVVFRKCQAQNGGAPYIEGGKRIDIWNSSFLINLAYSKGGAVFANEMEYFNIIGSIFFGQTALNGGAIFFQLVNALVLLDSHFFNNTAISSVGTECSEISGSGGALFISQTFFEWNKISIFNTTFDFNSAYKFGGALGFIVLEKLYNTDDSLKFVSNHASYGNDLGTVAQRISSNVSLSTLFYDDELTFRFQISDYLNQSVDVGSCALRLFSRLSLVPSEMMDYFQVYKNLLILTPAEFSSTNLMKQYDDSYSTNARFVFQEAIPIFLKLIQH
jgi:hypothetical protein